MLLYVYNSEDKGTVSLDPLNPISLHHKDLPPFLLIFFISEGSFFILSKSIDVVWLLEYLTFPLVIAVLVP